MTELPTAAAWRADQAAADTGWTQRLSAEEAEGFDAALRHARTADKPWLAMAPQDFPLPAASRAALQRAAATTQGRWGMCLLKGLPVDRWNEHEARLACWGIGLHMGVARTQNRASDFIADVRNEGGSYKGTNGRGYNTNAGLDFHCDSADVVALLCRRAAKRGGESKVVSSMAVVEELGRRRPDLLAVLLGPWFHSYQGAQHPDAPPYYMCPLVGSAQGHFAMRTNRKNVMAAQRDFPEVPRLTPQQVEVLDLLDVLMQDPALCFSMWLEPGDLQLLNNYLTLHSRTDFEDHDEPDLKRHLFRLWLALPQSQPLPPDWAEYFGDVRAGAVRGGLYGSGMTREFLDFEQRQAAAMEMPCRVRPLVRPVSVAA
ncbi:MAG: TauD/TfdA family dioxygenase [Aquincola tertiaricarbonis]